jgi:site-specific DNA-methyltransferase (adenine-specific)
MNRLLFGGNLKWLREAKLFPDASVDLVYLDPPFNSNADYNVLFREASGEASQAQFHAFTNTWNWADAGHLRRVCRTPAQTTLRQRREVTGSNLISANGSELHNSYERLNHF